MLQAALGASPVMEYQQQGKLDSLAASFNQTARAMDDGLALRRPSSACCIRAVLDRLLEGAVRELRQQAQIEAERLWQDALAGYSADVAGYFPFNAQSLAEAPLHAVARIFNPRNGAITLAVERLKAVRSYEITIGHIPDTTRSRLLEFSPEFEPRWCTWETCRPRCSTVARAWA